MPVPYKATTGFLRLLPRWPHLPFPDLGSFQSLRARAYLNLIFWSWESTWGAWHWQLRQLAAMVLLGFFRKLSVCKMPRLAQM